MRMRTVSGLQSNDHIFNSARGELCQDYIQDYHIFKSARGEPQGRDSCQSDSQREIREADIQHC